jgi:hypothetical protein
VGKQQLGVKTLKNVSETQENKKACKNIGSFEKIKLKFLTYFYRKSK